MKNMVNMKKMTNVTNVVNMKLRQAAFRYISAFAPMLLAALLVPGAGECHNNNAANAAAGAGMEAAGSASDNAHAESNKSESIKCAPKTKEDANKELRSAAGAGDAALVKCLIQSGADVNAKDKEGKTALIAAATKAPVEVSEELIKAGANVNAKDNYGSTALMEAVRYSESDPGRLDLIKALLAHKADVNAKDKTNMTALMLAITRSTTDQKFASLRIDKKLKHEMVKMLIAAGADVNVRIKGSLEEDGTTALMYAADYKDIEIVKMLLDAGANVNFKNINGVRAIDIAESDEMKELLKAASLKNKNKNKSKNTKKK